MKKVYVAGKLNDDAVGYIKNVHRMIKTARMLRGYGYAVYVPANDFIEGMVDGNFEYGEYFNNSQPWLMASDAVFLTPGWQESKGTAKEINLALEKGIPVFSDVDKMNEHFDYEPVKYKAVEQSAIDAINHQKLGHGART